MPTPEEERDTALASLKTANDALKVAGDQVKAHEATIVEHTTTIATHDGLIKEKDTAISGLTDKVLGHENTITEQGKLVEAGKTDATSLGEAKIQLEAANKIIDEDKERRVTEAKTRLQEVYGIKEEVVKEMTIEQLTASEEIARNVKATPTPNANLGIKTGNEQTGGSTMTALEQATAQIKDAREKSQGKVT